MQVAYGVLAALCALPCAVIGVLVIVNEAWKLEWIKVGCLIGCPHAPESCHPEARESSVRRNSLVLLAPHGSVFSHRQLRTTTLDCLTLVS